MTPPGERNGKKCHDTLLRCAAKKMEMSPFWGKIRREAAPAVINHTFPKIRFFRLHFVADNRAANVNNFDLVRPRSNLFGRNNSQAVGTTPFNVTHRYQWKARIGLYGYFITALHGMQERTIATRKLSIRQSVRLSNAWIVTKRKKDTSIFYIIRKII